MNFIIILLIIVLFTDKSVCLYLNSSLYGFSESTPITLPVSRFKRAPSEYTRWQADFEPTEEFIVKVFEEDSPVRNSQVAPIDVATKIWENNVESSLYNGPDSAEIVETANDPNSNHMLLNNFLKSNVDDNGMVSVPVYSNNKIISQKTFKGKIDTRYPKLKYLSVQNENQDSLLGSRFLSKLESPVQQLAPIEPTLSQEILKPPLSQFESTSMDLQFVPQLNSKATRTPTNPDIVRPLRTFNTEKFSPIRTTKTESFSMRNMIKDTISPFEYIHPIRSSTVEKPLRRLNKLFSMRIGTTKIVPIKEMKTFIDVDKNEDEYNMYIETSDKKTKIMESEEVNDIQNECQETELDIIESSTEYGYSMKTMKENELVREITRTTTILGLRRHSGRKKDSQDNNATCTMIKNRESDGSPRTLHEIVTQLKIWAENSPIAKWIDITNGNYTTMENPIYMMLVDDLSKGQIASAKETVLIVAGIQGKDHHAVLAAMSLLQQLIEKSESHSDLHRKYRFWIIPVLNPDGYEYSITFPLRRHWMKNLRQAWSMDKDDGQRGCQALGLSCTIQSCYGINLDRNFEYQWIPTKELQADHPCGSLYAGPRQLSEVETRSLTQYLDKKHIHTFIAYKEGDVLGVLYPYSHTKKKRPLDNFYRVRAMRAATAASVAGGRTYVYGQTSEYLPLYAGGIEDWVDGHLGIDNTYSVMLLRRKDDRESKALMEQAANEAFAATHALLFPSDDDQSHLPLAIRYTSTGTKISIEYKIVFITFIIFLSNR